MTIATLNGGGKCKEDCCPPAPTNWAGVQSGNMVAFCCHAPVPCVFFRMRCLVQRDRTVRYGYHHQQRCPSAWLPVALRRPEESQGRESAQGSSVRNRPKLTSNRRGCI